MKVKICFGIFGCGSVVEGNVCSCGNTIVREFDRLESFMRQCGKLPNQEAFSRAYRNITQHEPGIMDIEHYLRCHQGEAIRDKELKELMRDPYLEKFTHGENRVTTVAEVSSKSYTS